MNEQAPIPSWSEFIQSAGGSFTDEQYDSLAQEYFQAAVAPRVSQDALPFTWAQFKSYVDANRPERGIISEFGRGVAHGGLSRAVGAAGTAAEAAELGAQHATPLVSPEGVAAAHRAEDAAVQMQREYQSPYQSARNVHGLYDAMRWGAANLGEFVGNWGPRLLATNPVTGAVTGPMVAAEIPITTLGNVHAQARRGAEADSALKQTLSGTPPEQIDVSQAYRNIDQNKLALGTMGSTALEYAQGVVGPFGKAFLPTGWAKGGTDLLSGAVNRGGALGAMAGKTALSAGGEGLTEGLQTFPEEYGAGTPDWTGPRVQAEALDQGLGAMVGAGGPSFIDASRGGMLGGAMDQLRGLRNPEYRPNYQAYTENYPKTQDLGPLQPAITPEQYGQRFYTDPNLRQLTRGQIPELPAAGTSPAAAPVAPVTPPAPPPDPLADLNALESLAPTAFDPKKKGEPPKQLSFPEFKSRVQAARTAAAKDITDDDIAAYNEATKDLDDAAKPKLADFKKSQMGEDPKDPQILKAYTQYRALWDAGHRSFAAAKEAAVPPPAAPVFRDKATGQNDLFGDTYGKDRSKLAGPAQYKTLAGKRRKIPGEAPAQVDVPAGEQADMFGDPTLALPDQSVEGALDRAQRAQTPEEREAWLQVAIAREQSRQPVAESKAALLPPYPGAATPNALPPVAGQQDMFDPGFSGRTAPVADDPRFLSADEAAEAGRRETAPGQLTLDDARREADTRDAVRRTQSLYDQLDRQQPKVAPPDNTPTPLEQVSQEVLRLEQERAEALQRLNEARDEGTSTRELNRFNQELNAITNQLVKAKKQRTRLEEERDRTVQAEITAGRQVTNDIARPPNSPVDPRYIRAGARRTDILRSLKNGLRAPWIGKAGRKAASGRITQLINKGTIEPGEWSVVALPGSPKSAPYYVIRKDQEAPNETTVQEAQPTADTAAQEAGVADATGNTAGAPAEDSGVTGGTSGTPRGKRGSRRRADVAGSGQNGGGTAGSPKQRATPTGEPGDNGQSESALEGSPNYIAMNLDDLPNQGNESPDDIGRETGIEFSRNESAPTQGTTAGAVKDIVKQLTGRETSLKVVTHTTRAAAEKALGRTLDPKAKAFVLNGQAHFILDQIAPGSELAVFLHEVGAHLGMERLLTQAEQDRLYGAIERWAQSGSGVEKAAAQAALRRSQGNQQEAIAYFIEEAVNRGVNPTALDMKTPLGRWFQQLWSAFKRALRTLGINADQLSARDVVDLAYGAAGVELAGRTQRRTVPKGIERTFRKSKVRNPDGSLRRMYHATNKAFNQFDLGKLGSNTGAASARKGFFFAGRPETTVAYIEEPGEYAKSGSATPENATPAWLNYPVSTLYDVETAQPKKLNRRIDYPQVVEKHSTQGYLKGGTWWESEFRTHLYQGKYELVYLDRLLYPDEHVPMDSEEELGTYDTPEEALAAADKYAASQLSSALHQVFFGQKDEITPNTIPVFLNLENPLIHDMGGATYREVTYNDLIKRARQEGHDGAIIQNTYDGGPQDDIMVAFSPAQIHSAISFAPMDREDRPVGGDIRYSLTDAETKEQLFSALDKPWEGMKEWFVQAHKLPLLAEWFSELPALKDISKLEVEMQKTYDTLVDKVSSRVEDILSLDADVQAKLSKLMLDSTLWRIHPDAGFQVGNNTHLQAKDKAHYDEVRQAWDALPAEARKIYQQMRDTFQEQFDLRQKALADLAQKYMGAKAARRFARNLDILRKQSPGPYFPLVRFGEHVAVWKSKELLQAEQDEDLPKIAQLRQDENHYKVDFFDSERQALNQLNAWIKEGGDRTAPAGEPDDRFQGSHYTRRAPFIQGLNSGMTGLLDKMGQSLDNTFSSSAEKEAAKNALAEAFLSSLPDSSIFRSAMKRESIAGVKPEQMVQALAFHGGSQAFHISRLTHADDLQKAMERLKRQDAAAVMKGSKLSTYGPLSQIFVNSFASDAPSGFGKAMQKLTGASYYMTLATKPAFWLINAATPATTVIPWLSGRHSIGKGYVAWGKAMTDVFPILTPKSIKDYLRFSFTDAFQNSKLAPDEKKMLAAVAEAGAIDQSQIRELTQVAQGQRGTLDTAMRFLGGMAHRAEVMSRAASALTAYRLEKERTKSEDAATQYAIEAVNDMMVNYSMAHAPLIFRKGGKLGSPAAKMIFQYARYSASIGQELVHLARKWKNGDEEAKRQFLTLMAVNTLVAGTNGWLGAEAIKFAVETVANWFRPDDDELDIDAEVKKIMDKHFGKTLSLAARRGLPALTGLDLSESLGFQKVFNVRSESPFSAETKDEFALKLMSSAPAVGWALNIYDYIKNPDSKRVPISIVANTAKAIEQGQYGMVSRNGITKIKPEEYNTMDLILQGLGLMPTINAEGYQVQNSERIAKKHVATTKQDLLREYHVALKRKDGAAAREVMAKIKAFQSRHPGDKEARIDQRTLQKSERQRRQREESMNEYGVEQ